MEGSTTSWCGALEISDDAMDIQKGSFPIESIDMMEM